MQIEEMQKKTIKYLEEVYFKNGKIPKLLWNSKKSMEVEYEAISNMFNLKGKSVLDVGCGYCDFYYFLKKKGIILKKYVGIDLHPQIVEVDKKQFSNLDVRYGDILNYKFEKELFDFSIGCGILTFKIEGWKNRTEKILRKMFKVSKQGVIVNFLKDREEGPPKHPLSYYCKITDAIKIVEKITPYFNVKNDYRFNNFSIILLKKDI